MLKFSKLVHWSSDEKPHKTVCGKSINGRSLRHTLWESGVTCKACLAYLAKVCVCSKCGYENKGYKNVNQ